jgi:hypothetical protein
MILSFLIGSILSLVGRIGGDAMELVSYTLSEENLDNENDPFLIGQAHDVIKYLKICLHGNGSLESEFDLGDSLQHIEDIDEVLNGIDNVTTTFRGIIANLPSFTIFQEQIDKRKNYSAEELSLLGITDPDSVIPLQAALETLNNVISSKSEKWSLDGDTTKTCSSGLDSLVEGEYTFHPKYCRPIDRDWVGLSNDNIKDPAKIVSAIVDLVEKLNTFQNKITILKTKYDLYLNSYIDMLVFFRRKN